MRYLPSIRIAVLLLVLSLLPTYVKAGYGQNTCSVPERDLEVLVDTGWNKQENVVIARYREDNEPTRAQDIKGTLVFTPTEAAGVQILSITTGYAVYDADVEVTPPGPAGTFPVSATVISASPPITTTRGPREYGSALRTAYVMSGGAWQRQISLSGDPSAVKQPYQQAKYVNPLIGQAYSSDWQLDWDTGKGRRMNYFWQAEILYNGKLYQQGIEYGCPVPDALPGYPNARLNISTDKSTVPPGDTVRINLSVPSMGTIPLRGPLVLDIPGSISIVSGSDGVAIQGQQATWQVEIATGTSSTFWLDVKVPSTAQPGELAMGKATLTAEAPEYLNSFIFWQNVPNVTVEAHAGGTQQNRSYLPLIVK